MNDKRISRTQRRLAAARRGICKLYPRIEELKKELDILQDANLHLCNIKWRCEEELIKVENVPMGKSGRTRNLSGKALLERIEAMSEEEKENLIKKLQERRE